MDNTVRTFFNVNPGNIKHFKNYVDLFLFLPYNVDFNRVERRLGKGRKLLILSRNT